MIRHLAELYRRRELLCMIALREIKVRYKQSLLGAAWAVIQPLAMMLLFTLVFSKFAKVPSDGIPYPVFSYVALVPWTFTATSLGFAVSSVVGNASLIQKVHLPTEIFPLASVLAALVDFAVALVVVLAMFVVFRVSLSWSALLFFPVFLIQFVFTSALALLLSMVNVFYRDVRYAVPLVLQMWLFASPVGYPSTVVPEQYRAIYDLNPMAVTIESYRTVLLKGELPDFVALTVIGVGSVAALVACYVCFKRQERVFADVV